MPTGVFDSILLKHIWGTDELRAIFNDEMRVQKWFDYEAALAVSQAELGIIPQAAADEIAAKAKVEMCRTRSAGTMNDARHRRSTLLEIVFVAGRGSDRRRSRRPIDDDARRAPPRRAPRGTVASRELLAASRRKCRSPACRPAIAARFEQRAAWRGRWRAAQVEVPPPNSCAAARRLDRASAKRVGWWPASLISVHCTT